MADMIDITTGIPAIAFAGEVPWHGLGQPILSTDTLEDIQTKAGLKYKVKQSYVRFKTSRDSDETHVFNGRKVLFRDDTLAPLAVVGADYQVVQPDEIIGFFSEMVRVGGYGIETAGALSDGKRVWAMARVGEGANIIGQDRVLPYILAATSYDSSMATTVKFINMRVVCHNTISIALDEGGKEIKVYHSSKFDAARVRQDMGIALNKFEEWVIKARLMATRPVTEVEASEFVQRLIRPYTTRDDVTKTTGYQSIMGMFKGAAIGSGMTQGGTAWQLLNSVTQWVDHDRGRSADTRVNSAWFGEGDKLKSEAEALAMELVA